MSNSLLSEDCRTVRSSITKGKSASSRCDGAVRPRGGNEHHVVGGPGAGKTSRMYEIIREAIGEGYSTEEIVVLSFTDAAAWNAIQRVEDLGVPKANVGTLHSFAFRSLGSKLKIAEVHGRVMWNGLHPEYKLTEVVSGDSSVETGIKTVADFLLSDMQKKRAVGTIESKWSLQTREFARQWKAFKKANRYVDFADLIELAVKQTDSAPGNPRIIFVDEAQDLCPAEVGLIRKWGICADKLYLFFDPNQCIYSFKGASPSMLLNVVPISLENLPYSNRLPSSILSYVRKWMRRLPGARVVLDSKPENGTGLVRHAGIIKLSEPRRFSTDLLDQSYIENGSTVMVIAQCSYMLDRIKGVLFAEGIPFGNCYRPDKRDWNPLGRSARNESPSSVDRLRAFLRNDAKTYDAPRLWKGEEVWSLAETLIDSALLDREIESGRTIVEARMSEIPPSSAEHLRGFPEYQANLIGRSLARNLRDHYPKQVVDEETLRLVFTSEAVEAMLSADLKWFVANVRPKYRTNAFDYAMRVAKRFGRRALMARPPITLGTIHSVKGGEAEVVYLFPDISPAGKKALEGDDYASVIRTFYVGMTRAKRELVLCGPSKNDCPIEW